MSKPIWNLLLGFTTEKSVSSTVLVFSDNFPAFEEYFYSFYSLYVFIYYTKLRKKATCKQIA